MMRRDLPTSVRPGIDAGVGEGGDVREQYSHGFDRTTLGRCDPDGERSIGRDPPTFGIRRSSMHHRRADVPHRHPPRGVLAMPATTASPPITFSRRNRSATVHPCKYLISKGVRRRSSLIVPARQTRSDDAGRLRTSVCGTARAGHRGVSPLLPKQGGTIRRVVSYREARGAAADRGGEGIVVGLSRAGQPGTCARRQACRRRASSASTAAICEHGVCAAFQYARRRHLQINARELDSSRRESLTPGRGHGPGPPARRRRARAGRLVRIDTPRAGRFRHGGILPTCARCSAVTRPAMNPAAEIKRAASASGFDLCGSRRPRHGELRFFPSGLTAATRWDDYLHRSADSRAGVRSAASASVIALGTSTHRASVSTDRADAPCGDRAVCVGETITRHSFAVSRPLLGR